jgi:hypothetical protein
MSDRSQGAVVRRHPFAELESWMPWEPLGSVMDEFLADWPRELRRSSVALPSVDIDLPALTGPSLELVYAASWFMGHSFPGTMISGAGGRYPSALCGRMVL